MALADVSAVAVPEAGGVADVVTAHSYPVAPDTAPHDSTAVVEPGTTETEGAAQDGGGANVSDT